MTVGSIEKASRPELESMGKKLGIASVATLSKKDLIKQIEKAKATKVEKKPKVEEKPKVAEKAKVEDKGKSAKTAAPAKPAPAAAKAVPAPTKPTKAAPAAPAKPEKAEKAEKAETKASATHHEKTEKHDKHEKTTHKHDSDLAKAAAVHEVKAPEPKAIADSVTLVIRDAHWLHCQWYFQERTHQQAEIALGMDWAGAKMVLRLLDSTRGDHGRQAGQVIREIAIPKTASNWYLESGGPGRRLHAEIGYKTLEGKFYSLGQTSGIVTPHPGAVRPNQEAGGLPIDGATALAASLGSVAMSGEARGFLEERMRKSISSTPTAGIPGGSGTGKLQLNVEVEVHVTGTTAPNARVLVRGEPVRLKPEGTFFAKMKLNDGRLILPATAVSSDGREEKTVILAIERHTRYLDPSDRDVAEE